MSRFDASGKGFDEEPSFDEELFNSLLADNRDYHRDTFAYADKPSLNNVSDVLDALENMSPAKWDSVFFMLELIYETRGSDQKALHYDALGRIIGKHIVGAAENNIEIDAYNSTCDDYKNLVGRDST